MTTYCEHGERLEEYCSECLRDIASGKRAERVDGPQSTNTKTT